VEHRLAFEAKYPYPLFDVKAAIRFLRANAAKYKLDGDRFASCGDSAGAYYAVMAAATEENPAFEDLSMGNTIYSSKVKAVASWYGVFDILAQDEEVEKYGLKDPSLPDINKFWLGAQSKDIPGLMHFTNPLHFITKSFPPIFAQHGSDDHTVPCIQVTLLKAKINEVCGEERASVEILEGFDHGGFDPRWMEKEQIDKAFVFFDNHLK
jgi:acetyl esterase/lipase